MATNFIFVLRIFTQSDAQFVLKKAIKNNKPQSYNTVFILY
jgi:hypothetical protein